MKVIDFNRKGNLLKIFLGDDNCNDYWGDDWNDRPYEANAGTVYDKFVKATAQFVVPFEYEIVEPQDINVYNGNSPYCKDDFKNGVPFAAIMPEEKSWLGPEFAHVITKQDCVKLSYNMSYKEICDAIESVGGKCLGINMKGDNNA